MNQYQTAEFMKYAQDHQMKASVQMFNRLVMGCYEKCVSVGYYSGVRSCT